MAGSQEKRIRACRNRTQDHLLVARLFLSLKTTPQAQNYKPVNASEEGCGNEKCSRLAIFFSFQKTTFRANQIFYRTKKIICCKNLNLIFFFSQGQNFGPRDEFCVSTKRSDLKKRIRIDFIVLSSCYGV